MLMAKRKNKNTIVVNPIITNNDVIANDVIVNERGDGVIEVISGSANDDPVDQNKLTNIPLIESEVGWETIQNIEIKPTQGMALKQVKYDALPGNQFRIRSECRRGKSYNATIWNVVSNGIPRHESLIGHDIGGHDISTIYVQRRIGHTGNAILEYDLFGE